MMDKRWEGESFCDNDLQKYEKTGFLSRFVLVTWQGWGCSYGSLSSSSLLKWLRPVFIGSTSADQDCPDMLLIPVASCSITEGPWAPPVPVVFAHITVVRGHPSSKEDILQRRTEFQSDGHSPAQPDSSEIQGDSDFLNDGIGFYPDINSIIESRWTIIIIIVCWVFFYYLVSYWVNEGLFYNKSFFAP